MGGHKGLRGKIQGQGPLKGELQGSRESKRVQRRENGGESSDINGEQQLVVHMQVCQAIVT